MSKTNSILLLFAFIILPGWMHAQTSFKVGSGVYQFSNYDPSSVGGITVGFSHQFNSQKIKRLGLHLGINFDYYASSDDRLTSIRTFAKGNGINTNLTASFAVVQKERFEWRVAGGGFLSHYQVRFQQLSEQYDQSNGNRIRNYFEPTEEVGSAFGYRLTTSLRYKLKSNRWIILYPLENMIAPNGYAHNTISLGFTF